MVCPKCSSEISGSTKFCPECGEDLSTKFRTVSLRCKACGGVLNAENGSLIMQCPHCGSKELIEESDDVTIERIKSQTQKDIELSRQKFEKEKELRKDEKEKQQKFEEKQMKFKKSFFSKFLIIMFIICLALSISSFSSGNILQGIIGILQTALFAAAWLLGMQIIKEKFFGMHTIAAVLGFVLLFLFAGMGRSNRETKKDETYVWPVTGICQILPQPESESGNIMINSDSYFLMDLYNCTEQQYNDYIKACMDTGFTLDSETSTMGYEAYNGEGYKLSLSYLKSSGEITIRLYAPKEESATDDNAVTTTEKPKAPEESGEDEFEWEDEAEPEDKAETSAEESDEPDSAENLIRPEIKEAIDSYEAFMDEYIEFMEKYNNSGNTLSMLADYTKFITKYAEMAKNFSALDDGNLTDAEALYYSEVSLRVSNKLLKAAVTVS